MVKLKLQHPIEFDGNTITELELARPKMKHLKNMGQNFSLADIMLIASKVSGQPNKVIEELDGADGMRLAEIIGSFLESTPKTGDS